MLAVNEGVSVHDLVTPRPSAMLAVNEGVSVHDLVTPQPSAMITITEGIAVHDDVKPHRINIVFAAYAKNSFTSVTEIDATSAGPAPKGYTISGPAFDISITGSYKPPINICFNLPEVTDRNIFDHLRVLHGETDMNKQIVLVDRTTEQDFNGKNVCAQVNSLSRFVIVRDAQPDSRARRM